jgi:hypothetical protein
VIRRIAFFLAAIGKEPKTAWVYRGVWQSWNHVRADVDDQASSYSTCHVLVTAILCEHHRFVETMKSVLPQELCIKRWDIVVVKSDAVVFVDPMIRWQWMTEMQCSSTMNKSESTEPCDQSEGCLLSAHMKRYCKCQSASPQASHAIEHDHPCQSDRIQEIYEHAMFSYCMTVKMACTLESRDRPYDQVRDEQKIDRILSFVSPLSEKKRFPICKPERRSWQWNQWTPRIWNHNKFVSFNKTEKHGMNEQKPLVWHFSEWMLVHCVQELSTKLNEWRIRTKDSILKYTGAKLFIKHICARSNSG